METLGMGRHSRTITPHKRNKDLRFVLSRAGTSCEEESSAHESKATFDHRERRILQGELPTTTGLELSVDNEKLADSNWKGCSEGGWRREMILSPYYRRRLGRFVSSLHSLSAKI